MDPRVRSWLEKLVMGLAVLCWALVWSASARAASEGEGESGSADSKARGSVDQSRNASFPAPEASRDAEQSPSERSEAAADGEPSKKRDSASKSTPPKSKAKPKASKKKDADAAAKQKAAKTKAAKAKAAKAKAAKAKAAKAKAAKAKAAKQPKRRRWTPPPPIELTQTEKALQESLQLTVHERGPFKPWTILLRNVGERPVIVASDSRLLWLEATVPGRASPVTCRLPDTMSPDELDEASPRHLAPGAVLRFRVDPRLYCFESRDQTILVPGTFVRTHFGWPEKTVTRWRDGRRQQERVEQKPPYFAHLAADPVDPSAPSTRDEGLKAVRAEGLALGSDYIAWARARPDDQPLRRRDLELAITYASDARAPRDVTVTLQLTNHGRDAVRVYFRRDLLSFEVRAPDGLHECAPEAAPRAPDVQGFTRLGPGQSTSLTTRLFEFCPSDAFIRPGLYYVGAHLHAIEDGAEYGVDAFTGRLATRQLRPLRLHSGELPFLTRRKPLKTATAPVPYAAQRPQAATPPAAPTPPPPSAPAPAQ